MCRDELKLRVKSENELSRTTPLQGEGKHSINAKPSAKCGIYIKISPSTAEQSPPKPPFYGEE